MGLKIATADIHVGDQHLVTGCPGHVIKVVLHGILREAVTDGKYLDNPLTGNQQVSEIFQFTIGRFYPDDGTSFGRGRDHGCSILSSGDGCHRGIGYAPGEVPGGASKGVCGSFQIHFLSHRQRNRLFRDADKFSVRQINGEFILTGDQGYSNEQKP